MSEPEQTCRWNGRENPRVLPGRHGDECPGEECKGCRPCTDRHCDVCERIHVEDAWRCPGCVGEVRSNLAEIGKLCRLPLADEAEASGVESEAMMLRGPVANQEAWYHRRDSALAGRIPKDYLEDARDEKHPLFVLGTWELLWREWFDHDSDQRVTITGAVDYLSGRLTEVARMGDVPFPDLAADVRGTLAHLEDVLHDSQREERGAPCPSCREEKPDDTAPRLVKRYVKADRTGASDFWKCPRCRSRWTDAEYRLRVGSDYLEHAPELTISDMATRTGVAAGTIRRWAASTTKIIDDEVVTLPPRLRHSGRTEDGRKMYRVADVEALRPQDDAPTQQTA